MPSAFTPLVRAVLDALGEGVVVLDANGHLVYANQTGRSVIEQLGARAGGNEGELRALLLRQGARVAPLRIGDSTLGEAAYLPEADINSGTLAERERQAIFETLEATGWKLTDSAKRLGISRTTLWRRLKAYGLNRERQRSWVGSP
jgi:transcriptional regulator of acetoin/glycerol metabolism